MPFFRFEHIAKSPTSTRTATVCAAANVAGFAVFIFVVVLVLAEYIRNIPLDKLCSPELSVAVQNLLELASVVLLAVGTPRQGY